MGFSVSGAVGGAGAGSAFGPWGAAAGGVIGGFFGGSDAESSVNSAQALNSSNVDLARETMAWEERMSNTAHQREVTDLRAAGLNPILSATHGGAVTPPGIMPPQVNPDVNKASDRAAEMGVLLNSAKLLSEVKLNAAQADNYSAQASNTRTNFGVPGFAHFSGSSAQALVAKAKQLWGQAGGAGKALKNLFSHGNFADD